jgi:hypothetical protein
MEFRHFVQLIAIGLQARIPMHMTGFPGVGKTEFTKSLEAGFARAGIKCKVFILIGRSRAAGLRRLSGVDAGRRPPAADGLGARRAAARRGRLHGGVFLDELTTVPPTTQAAMLRLLTENVCGELRCRITSRARAASSTCAPATPSSGPPAAGDPAPMANRLWHGEFPMDPRDVVRHDVTTSPRPPTCPRPRHYFARAPSPASVPCTAYVRAIGARCVAVAAREQARASVVGVRPHVYRPSRFLARPIEAVSPGNRSLQGPPLAGLVGDQALPYPRVSRCVELPFPKTS